MVDPDGENVHELVCDNDELADGVVLTEKLLDIDTDFDDDDVRVSDIDDDGDTVTVNEDDSEIVADDVVLVDEDGDCVYVNDGDTDDDDDLERDGDPVHVGESDTVPLYVDVNDDVVVRLRVAVADPEELLDDDATALGVTVSLRDSVLLMVGLHDVVTVTDQLPDTDTEPLHDDVTEVDCEVEDDQVCEGDIDSCTDADVDDDIDGDDDIGDTLTEADGDRVG